MLLKFCLYSITYEFFVLYLRSKLNYFKFYDYEKGIFVVFS